MPRSEQDSSQGLAIRRFSLSFSSLRFFCLAAFVFSLFWFVHVREVRRQLLEVGALSQQYIIAQIDFSYPDDESTFLLRQKASEEMGVILKFSSEDRQQCVADFEEMLTQDSSWRQHLPQVTYEELYEASDNLEIYLKNIRLTDFRTLQKIKHLGFNLDQFYAMALFDQKLAKLPETFWSDVRKKIFIDSDNRKEAVEKVVSFYSRFPWQLREDTALEKKVKHALQQSIPQQYTHIEAGTAIIEKGEKITEKHLDMLQAMNAKLGAGRDLWNFLSIAGSAIFSLLITALVIFYLRTYHENLLADTSKTILASLIFIMTLAAGKCAEFLLLHKGLNLIEGARYPILIPFAAVLFTLLLGARLSLFLSVVLTLIMGISLAVDHDRFIIMNLSTAVFASLISRHLHKRKQIFEVFIKTWLLCIPLLVAFNLMEEYLLGWNFLSDLMTTFVFLAGSALLVVGILPLFESLFKVTTSMALMEYMDPNNDLLRRLSCEAPGTYQHCLVVGSIAEAAARAIGANDLFCRAATLYHDIGKLSNPHYFTENQLGAFNIHQLLTPYESTQVILSHVVDGELLAKKSGLPQSFIDVIKEHHGTTLVYYFYKKALELCSSSHEELDEKKFRYPGPKPRSKESAIIMIADSAEAASRSLEDPSEESLEAMVKKLVRHKSDEGQFDDCKLTFEELGTVQRAIVKALLVSRHIRVSYPARG